MAYGAIGKIVRRAPETVGKDIALVQKLFDSVGTVSRFHIQFFKIISITSLYNNTLFIPLHSYLKSQAYMDLQKVFPWNTMHSFAQLVECPPQVWEVAGSWICHTKDRYDDFSLLQKADRKCRMNPTKRKPHVLLKDLTFCI